MSDNRYVYQKRELPSYIGKIGYFLLAVGVILGALSYILNPPRASFSYLTSYMYLVSIGIGSLFLVALEYAAGAVWSTPFRRIVEFLSASVPLLIILALPLVFNLDHLFLWANKLTVMNDENLQQKTAYLNVPFQLIRLGFILITWIIFYWVLTKNSRKQDLSGDQKLTAKNVRISMGFLIWFAISISIIAVDWMLSIEPHWYSTIFGVYYFAGTAWASLAALTLIVVLLRENGYLTDKIKKDHYYSLGTLLFAFTCFWGYIAFSQYVLIWYGDLPHETSWFFHRWGGIWSVLSTTLVVAHFIVPFFALLSFPSKTSAKRLKFMSIWILIVHFLDIYWLVMPGMKVELGGYYFSWSDLVFPIAVVGLLMIIFNMMAKKQNLIPIGDPKLQRGFDFHL
jgi:hypothetical protein